MTLRIYKLEDLNKKKRDNYNQEGSHLQMRFVGSIICSNMAASIQVCEKINKLLCGLN